MGDIMASGAAWLTDQLQANVAQPVSYLRDGAILAILATFGRKLLAIDDGIGSLRLEMTDCDFIVPAAALQIDGIRFEPERGDTVTLNRNGVTEVYEVLPFGSEQPWGWCDPFGEMMRIHTKRIQ